MIVNIEIPRKRLNLYLILNCIVAILTGLYSYQGEILRYKTFSTFICGMCISMILITLAIRTSKGMNDYVSM